PDHGSGGGRPVSLDRFQVDLSASLPPGANCFDREPRRLGDRFSWIGRSQKQSRAADLCFFRRKEISDLPNSPAPGKIELALNAPRSFQRGNALVRIDGLAFGGDAVGRDESGRVVFVPGGAPGDVVEVRIVEEK